MQASTKEIPLFKKDLIKYNNAVKKFTDLKAPRVEDRHVDIPPSIAHKLEEYLSETSCSSVFSYLFFVSPTPRLTSPEDPIVENILNHSRNGLFDSHREVLLRLSLIDTSKNERLAVCIKEIQKERRASVISSSSEQAIALFLNAFHYRTWNLSNVYNPALFKEIETLSITLQKKISELQSYYMLDNYRAEYFIQYIDAYLECFSEANAVFSIGNVIDRNKPIPAVQDHLKALLDALDKTKSYLPLYEQKEACSDLIRRAREKEESCQRLSLAEADMVIRSPRISLKF